MCASYHVGKRRIRFLLHNSPSNQAIFRYLRGGALSYKLTTPSVCSLHSHPPPSTGRLNVEVCTVPKGATIYGGAVERSETEGEHLAALASSELFPFQLLITFAATFPVNGDSFWVCNTMCQFSPCCIPRSGRSAAAPSPANLARQDRPGKMETTEWQRKRTVRLDCSFLWYPAATYLPGPSPAKYCRRTRA